MRIDYVEQQVDGEYKFFRKDEDGWLEIPANRIPKRLREIAIKNWIKRNTQPPTTIF